MWTSEERLNYIYAFVQFDMKNIQLDFWQDYFIKSKKQYISILKSRRTGFSFATALKGIAKSQDPARSKYVKQFVSYNEGDAVEKIRYAKEFYDSIPSQYKKPLVHANNTELEFLDTNGKTTSRLISLPCRPPRGKGGDISLDEYAIYLPKVSNTIYTAALYVIMRGGCIEVGSTPLGTIGKFYDICTKPEDFPDYERYNVPWWFAQALCIDVPEAIKQAGNMTTAERVERFGTDILKSIYRNSLEEDFQQECECTFIDSAASYISLDLIYANTPGKREQDIPTGEMSDDDYFNSMRDIEVKPYHDVDSAILNYDPEKHGGPLYLGYDVAKNHDGAAFYMFGLKDGKKREYYREEFHNAKFEEQKDICRRLMTNLPVYRAVMDETGMGAPVFEALHNEFGDRIEGITFTLESKEMLAMSAKFGLENCEFELSNDREFHNQIHSIKRAPSVGKHFRYDADRNEKGHADSFWAWAMANYASLNEKQTSFYDQYAQSKKESVIKSPEEILSQAIVNQANIIRRGHSADTVLRHMMKNQRR